MRDTNLVDCRLSVGEVQASAKAWKQGEDTEFMYMPAGVFIANGASYRGKGVVLAVKVDPTETAEQLRTSLKALVAQNPKQAPFGCIEHREEDASVWASDFVARETGVYLVAKPSSLGESHVNGQIHRGWSPSFTTDAEYDKAVLKGNVLYFPEGVRGSVSNPARVTGTGFCVGTLTNKPAIKNLDPVTASEFVDTESTTPDVLASGVVDPPNKQETVTASAPITPPAVTPDTTTTSSIDDIFAKLTPIVTSESVWARVTKISPGGGPTGKPAA